MSEISNNNEYIPRAERRNKDGLTEKEFLEQYNPGHYERPSVTVDMLLFGMSRDLKCLKVLLIKRNRLLCTSGRFCKYNRISVYGSVQRA